jgi:hypothetical protein
MKNVSADARGELLASNNLASNNLSQNNEQARAEIQSFLEALDSYPELFAQNPNLTFEEHRRNVAVAVVEHHRSLAAAANATR